MSEPLLRAYTISQQLHKELDNHTPDLTLCRRLVYSLEETCIANLKTTELTLPKTKVRIITTLTTTEFACKNLEELAENLTTMQLRILLCSFEGTDLTEVIKFVRKCRGYESVGVEIIAKQIAQLKERELLTVQDLCEEAFEAYRKTIAANRARVQSTTKGKGKKTNSKMG